MDPQTLRPDYSVPARKIGMGHRGIRGRLMVHGHAVAYESGLERDFLTLLDFDLTVAEARGQPVRIAYRHPDTGRPTAYVPDAYVRLLRPRPREILVQVKHAAELRADFGALKHRYIEARRYAREHGMTHAILTEAQIRGARLTNAKWLGRYLRIDPDARLEEQLAATLAALGPSTPQQVMAAAFYDQEDRTAALPYLWRMIAVGRIHADLGQVLTNASPITITVGEGYRWTDPYAFRSRQDRSCRRSDDDGA